MTLQPTRMPSPRSPRKQLAWKVPRNLQGPGATRFGPSRLLSSLRWGMGVQLLSTSPTPPGLLHGAHYPPAPRVPSTQRGQVPFCSWPTAVRSLLQLLNLPHLPPSPPAVPARPDYFVSPAGSSSSLCFLSHHSPAFSSFTSPPLVPELM